MNLKKFLSLVQIVCIIFFNVGTVRLAKADDSDIFGNTNIAPNVDLLISSSSNMTEEIRSDTYVASTTYNTPSTYTTATVYKWLRSTPGCKPQPSPCYTFYAASISAVTDTTARTALQNVGYWTGSIGGSSVSLFHGNYLNYTACTTCGTLQSKISIARTVMTNLINNTTGLRFGAAKYGAGGGLQLEPIRDMTDTNKQTLVNSINTMTLDSSGNPLGAQLKQAAAYYEGRLSGLASPTLYVCQPSFAILITDGIATGPDPVAEATNLFTQDHSDTFPGMQNVIVHVVAFALPQADKDAGAIQQLQNIAIAGGGSFFQAENAAQLEKALQNAFSQIIAATFSFATPVVPTTGTAGTTRAYLASFQSSASRPFWRGFLKAYNRDSNGLIQVDADGIPLASSFAWDAGQVLSTTSASSRTIYTAISGALEAFTDSNSNITNAMMGASSSSEKNDIINFTRGIDTYDEDFDFDVTEQRQWKLGDIFHSTPVLVTPPFLASSDPSYSTFKTANASRTSVLLAGANDGMLHSFRESDGAELWGFVPPEQLSNVKQYTPATGLHDFSVDGSPIAADVKIGATPTWKTVVLFGQRRGGKNYYGLDITNTTNPVYKWSFTDSRMSETWSDPAVGKIKMSDNTDKYVAFVGGGYDTASNNNSGKIFFVIDIDTGTKLWEYYNPVSVSDDRQYMNFSLAAAPTAVDLNGDGYIDRVYIGDVGGQLWKFDVSTPATVSGGVITNWNQAQKGKRFFIAAASQTNPPAAGEFYPAQAIYAPPTLAYDTSNTLWVSFGTGDRNHPNNTSSNRLYGIKDTTEVNGEAVMTQGSALTESSLTNLTSGSGSVTQGWYVVLNNNEKVLAAADIFNSIAYFTTFTPSTTVSCGGGGGDAKLYAINLTTGDAALNLTTGAILVPGTAALTMAKTIGSGIPSKPIIIMSQSGNQASPYLISGTTNNQISTTPVPQVTVRKLVGWREVF